MKNSKASSLIALLVACIQLSASQNIFWNGNWAFGCDFYGNDLSNVKATGDKCGEICGATNGCTHFVWTNHQGGTCWLKRGSVTKFDAIVTNDPTMVCGIIIEGTTNPVQPSGGNSDFPGCQFKAGRLYDQPTTDYSKFDYITIWLGTIAANTDFNIWYQGEMIKTCVRLNKIPVFYAYIIAFEARFEQNYEDCDVDANWNLCRYGATYIRTRRAHILSRYNHQASSIAASLGKDRTAIFLIEPDLWQYHGDPRQLGGGLTGTELRELFNSIVSTIKNHLPKALIAFDISAWIGEDGFRAYWNHFKDSQIDFLFTSGGQAYGGLANIKPGELRWSFVSQVTGKKIIADCGYGVAGHASDNCNPWSDAATLNNRKNDGVIALSQSNQFLTISKPNLC